MAKSAEQIRQETRGYVMALRKRRADLSQCTWCGSPGPTVRETDRMCMDCWFKHIARQRTGSSKDAAMLREIFEDQGGRCAYTGEVLVPGKSASLDHKTPSKRGGTNQRDNLQWVTRRINTMKSNLTHEEFISLCREIVRFTPDGVGIRG